MKTGRVAICGCMLAALLSAPAHGTTIVAVRVPGGIMVLADSKPVDPGAERSKPACKIVPIKNAYVAVSGMVRDAARQFDAEEIAARAFDSPGKFEAHVKLAMEQIEAKTSEEIARLRAEDPKRYSFALKSGAGAKSSAAVVHVLFFGFENHVAMLAERKLQWNEAKSKWELQKHDCPGKACPDGHYVSKVGEVSEIEKFLATHKQSDLGESTLHDLMVQQAQTTPSETAAPIQVLSLQDGAPIWLANDAGCPLQK